MIEYPKIQTLFKRDMASGKIIEGDFTLPEFEYLKDNIWVFTEKVDGTNIRVIFDKKGAVTFKGRTDKSQIPAFLFNKLKEIFQGKTQQDMCLYGEGYGARIQKGGENYIKDGVDFVLFDVRVGDLWLKREEVEEIALSFGIKVVPIIGEGTLTDMVEMVKKGFKSKWGDFIAEGIVARPKVELQDRNFQRIITKLKHRDFVKEG
jgi:ATP-dependent RNA circularization protein (DNA/RNA ligase family)